MLKNYWKRVHTPKVIGGAKFIGLLFRPDEKGIIACAEALGVERNGEDLRTYHTLAVIRTRQLLEDDVAMRMAGYTTQSLGLMLGVWRIAGENEDDYRAKLLKGINVWSEMNVRDNPPLKANLSRMPAPAMTSIPARKPR